MKHKEMANAMLNIERAINAARKIADIEISEACMKGNEEFKEWYTIEKGLEAMTQIKCMIDVEW